MIRAVIAVACMLLFAADCRAELRIIAVKIVKAENAKPQVSVYSDVKSEDKRGLPIEEAAKILKNAEGWGSSVMVGIQARDVSLAEYLPILQAISENPWLELVFVEGREPGPLSDNLKKRLANP